MHISQESTANNSIQAYSDTQIKISSVIYEHNVLIAQHKAPEPWSVKSLSELTVETLAPLLASKPEIILIGHMGTGKDQFAPSPVREYLAEQRIGLETLSIGAACRTFNILLAEDRAVVLAVMFG